MAKMSKYTVAEMEQCERDGLTVGQAAEKLGVHRRSIHQRLEYLGRQWQGKVLRKRQNSYGDGAPVHPVTNEPAAPAGADHQLVETGGRYADLSAYADANSITFREAQRRWHALGLPLVARKRSFANV